MKILFISGTFPPIKCGVGDYTYMLCKELAKGQNISVLTSKEAKLSDLNIEVKNFISSWKGISIIRNVVREIKKDNYDIVHFQFPTSKYVRKSICFHLLLPLILRLKGIKVVYTIHEYSNNSFISKLVRKSAIYFSNRVIVVEESFREEILKRNRFINKNKLKVINIGSNIAKSYATNQQIIDLRKQILLKKMCSYSKIIAYFGFINEAKCFDIVLKAFGELKRIGKLDSLLLIIGDFNSDKCSKSLFVDLASIISNYGIDENIFVTGYVDNDMVGDYLRVADGALLLFKNGASVRNGSILAAQQEGLKIITSIPNEKNLKYFNNNQFFLVENNVEQIMRAIIDLQDNKMEFNNQSNVAEWSFIASEHIKLYENMLKR